MSTLVQSPGTYDLRALTLIFLAALVDVQEQTEHVKVRSLQGRKSQTHLPLHSQSRGAQVAETRLLMISPS